MIRSISACVTSTLVLLANALFGAPAMAQPTLAPPELMLRMDVHTITPRIVDADSRTLTVAATLTNVSDRKITGLTARLQLGAPIGTEAELGDALAGDLPIDTQLTPFREVAAEIAPGQSAQLAITVGLRGEAEALVLNEPGVYPLLINVNGTPDYGSAARLAALNMLLPVMAAPGQERTDSSGPATHTSTLWPISYGSPRVLASRVQGRLLLPDERLAEALSPGGRLHALVSAAESARTDERVFDSLCFAIDPALIATVHAMTNGYQVRTPTGRVKGTGAAAARDWLAGLRTLVADRCAIALPYAGADLTALAREYPDLARMAAGEDTVLTEVLKARPTQEAFWPQGALPDDTLDALLAEGRKVLVTDSRLLEIDTPVDGPLTLLAGNGASTEARAVPFNGLFASALARRNANPVAGGNTALAAGEPSTAGQNGVAVLAYLTRFAAQRPSGRLLLAPPMLFAADVEELSRTLNALSAFTAAGMIDPQPMSELLAEAPSGTARSVSAADGGLGTRMDEYVVERIDRTERTLADLDNAMKVDATKQVTPEKLLAPVRQAMLRSASTFWRGHPELSALAVEDAEDQLRNLLHNVQVSNPGRTISMASGAAPIPVVITNDLPVQVAIHLTLSNTIGLRPDPVGDLIVPANSQRTLYVPTKALRAGRFSVDAALSTPGGTELGDPTRFELASTEYGAITVIVTATAAGALLLLSGRRIYRRIRNGRAERGEAA